MAHRSAEDCCRHYLLNCRWPREHDLGREGEGSATPLLIGMGAPAIFTSARNNVQAGFNRPAHAPAKAEVSTLSPGSPTMPYVRPYFAVIGARMTSDGEPSVMLPAANFADEKTSAVDFLSEVFRAIGVSGADSRTVVPLTLLASAMLAIGAYGAWVSIQRRKALALLTVRLAMIEPGIQSDGGTNSKPRPEPEGTAALLNKGDSLEKGLGALVEGRLEPAFELFTQAISEVVDAFNYRAQASFYMGRYESALRDFSTFLELRPYDAAGLFNKGVVLSALNRSEEEIAVYDEVVSRFGTAAEPALRKVADTASEQIRTIAARTH